MRANDLECSNETAKLLVLGTRIEKHWIGCRAEKYERMMDSTIRFQDGSSYVYFSIVNTSLNTKE